MKSSLLRLNPTGLPITLKKENEFIDQLDKQISKKEKEIPWKIRKAYKIELAKQAQGYVLSLISLKGDKELKKLEIKAQAFLQQYETNLLAELIRKFFEMIAQTAIDIEKDSQDAKKIAEQLDSKDLDSFIDELKVKSFQNLKNIASMENRNIT